MSLYQDFFSGARTIPQWSADARALGLDAVDINALFIREKTPDEIAAIREQLTLPVLMVSAYSDFTLPDRTERAAALETALADMHRAAAIGARYIRLTAGQAHPGQPDDVACRRVYECFARCAEESVKLGVGILLENHSKPGAWQYPDFNFHMDRFLRLWDTVGPLPIHVNFDTANAFALGDWQRILRAVSGRIATVHLNDLASLEPLAFARVGEGIVPMEEMLDAVYATGFAGDLCIEEAAFRGWDGIAGAAAWTVELARKYGFGQ